MKKTWHPVKTSISTISVFLALVYGLISVNEALCGTRPNDGLKLRETPLPRTQINLKAIPFKIVYETYRKTNGKENWELYTINADGSNPVNLTRTSDIHELYPHASPDGSKICFAADEGTGATKVRNVYYMNIDGTGRVKVADNARQPCWSPDSKTIAYLKGEFDRYTIKDFATKGVFFYDLKTKKHTQHPNKYLRHLYNISWSPDGKYIAFSHGPKGQEMVGGEAPGWNICVADMSGKWVEITTDGNHNKEPDWVPVRNANP